MRGVFITSRRTVSKEFILTRMYIPVIVETPKAVLDGVIGANAEHDPAKRRDAATNFILSLLIEDGFRITVRWNCFRDDTTTTWSMSDGTK